jgi:hypothetical protein
VTALGHVGGPGEAPLRFEFSVPARLRGGGLPAFLYTGQTTDTAILEIEIPQLPAGLTDEEHGGGTGVGMFDGARLCRVWDAACAERGQDGYWRAILVGNDGSDRELQMAIAMKDQMAQASGVPLPYFHVLGVYLPGTQTLRAGDRVRLEYTGHLPGRSTEWTDRPFVAHFRYRSFSILAGGALEAGAWTTLSDEDVGPLQIHAAEQAAFVRAVAPLDVEAGVPFTVAVVVTDPYGNPRPISGSVILSEGVDAEVQFAGEWRRELTAVYQEPGAYRIIPSLPGARAIYHHTRAWSGAPPVTRLLGDVHIHTGDGGAQRKFLGSMLAGDHAGLYSRTRDALGYLERVAGYDFGAISEHAVREPSYALPPEVLNDPEFQEGGACAGVGHAVPGNDDWWEHSQSVVAEYGAEPANHLIAFPAFEWHAQQIALSGRSLQMGSPLHRVTLFRDFDPENALPILPGDQVNVPPQCLLRFLSLVGKGPEEVLVIPHMMGAKDTNIDWELSYADTTVAPRSETERYQRVGEVFSARAYNQGLASGRALLTAFEGDDPAAPGAWTYRHGWRDLGAHIGLMGSSDNHSQMPGVDDPLPADGSEPYHLHEPTGTAVVLADARDRDGVYEALLARRSYATSGVRVWLDFDIDGAPMGSAVESSGAEAGASLEVMAGMTIVAVELWRTRVGSADPYELVHSYEWQPGGPRAESYSASVTLPNPVAQGAPAEEWLYYTRVFLETPGAEDGEADDAAWSSPVWVTWSR